MNQYLRWGIYTGLFAVLFIPFIVANDFFFPFITGKNFAFRIIVEMVFAAWVVLAVSDPSARPKKSVLLYALGALVLSMGISTVLAENPSKAFWSNFERMEGYIGLLHFAAYFLVISSVFTAQKLWNRFFNTSIVMSVLLALYGVGQLAGWFTINQGGVRVDATFGNATYLAVYMLFHVFLTLYLLVRERPARWLQVYYAAAIVLQTLMIFYAATRGTILGLVGGLFLTGLIFVAFGKGNEQRNAGLRKFGATVALALVVLAGGFIAIKDTDFVRNNDILTRVASISLQEGQVRFMVWGMAWEGFKERPIFGWGQEGFNYVFNKHYNPAMYAQEPWFDRAHNAFIDWAVAGGVVGFILFMLVFLLPLWYLWRREAGFDVSERAIFTGLLAGYAVHNFFVFDNLISSAFFFTVIAFILSRYASAKKLEPLAGIGAPSMPVRQGIAAFALIVAIGVLYAANVPGITRAAGIIDALKPHDAGLSENFERFKKTLGPSGMGRQEAYEQFLQFASRIRTQALADRSTQEFRDEVALFAIDAFAEEIARNPNDARLRLFSASFFRQLGLYPQADREAQKAHEFSPRKQSPLLERALIATNQGDNEAALSYAKEAYELAPEYDQARIIYAASAVRAGDGALAERLLVEGFGTTNVVDLYLQQAYISVGNTERVIELAKAKVSEFPNDLQGYLELAANYMNTGRRTDTLEVLQAAVERFPDFKEQGEYYIAEIRAGRNP